MTLPFLKSAPGKEPVVVEGVFAAPVERVYRAWTDAEELKAWFGLKPNSILAIDVDLRVGGRWQFVMVRDDEGQTSLFGEYLVIEPGRRLAFSWHSLRENVDGSREESAPSKVTVTFTAQGAATAVHLTHETIVAEEGRLGVSRGWNASFASLTDLFGEG